MILSYTHTVCTDELVVLSNSFIHRRLSFHQFGVAKIDDVLITLPALKTSPSGSKQHLGSTQTAHLIISLHVKNRHLLASTENRRGDKISSGEGDEWVYPPQSFC